MTEQNVSRALSWDDCIENDGGEYTKLEPGTYQFVVTEFKREWYQGGAKIPACNKAVLQLSVDGLSQGKANVRHQLLLHTETEWTIAAFFTAIGQRRKGEKLKPNWDTVDGSTGWAEIGLREYKTDKGEDRTTNEVVKFLESPEAFTARVNAEECATGSFTAGKF